MDIKTNFSFLKLYNTIKGVTKAVPEDARDVNWLEKRAGEEKKKRF